MNRLKLFPVIILLLCSCRPRQSQNAPAAPPPAQVTFADTLHDFGTFPADSAKRTYTFRFTNTGTAPAAVVNVSLSCHCLSAEYTREVIRPGQSGTVTLTFDGKDAAPGYFDKSARVRFNSPRVYTLRLRGTMEE